MSEPFFRPAEVADVDAIAGLLAREVPHCVPEPRERLLGQRSAFWVAVSNGTVIATSAIHVTRPGEAEIRSVAVAEDHRGEGLGSEIVRRLIGWASWNHIRRVHCVSRSPEFFESLGFRRSSAPPPPRDGMSDDEGAAGPRIWLSMCVARDRSSTRNNQSPEQLAS